MIRTLELSEFKNNEIWGILRIVELVELKNTQRVSMSIAESLV